MSSPVPPPPQPPLPPEFAAARLQAQGLLAARTEVASSTAYEIPDDFFKVEEVANDECVPQASVRT